MIALIPARAGSKRVVGKNTRLLGGVPLIAWTIAAAKESGCVHPIIVTTDDPRTVDLAIEHGADYAFVAGPPCHTDTCRDITWMQHALKQTARADSFAILRPTSPFRTPETIRRCYREFSVSDGTHDSIRAVEPVKQHPGKMWTWEGPGYPIKPYVDKTHPDGTPWHSSPTQSLPKIYVQNSSLEMGYTSNIEVHGTIHGRKVIPFFTEGYEGFTIDYPDDFTRAEALVAAGTVALPAGLLARV